MSNKYKTTYRLPKDLKVKMTDAVNCYGKKRKSLWINEAIILLIKDDLVLANVGLGEDLEVKSETDVLLLDENTYQTLEYATIKIRRQDPTFEGVRSAIIRAAIRYRLENSLQE